MQAMQRRAFFTLDEIGTYSDEQMDVFLFLKGNHTWQQAILQFNLTGPQVVSTLILRTAMGYRWDAHQNGGRNSIISQVDEKELVKQLKERADQADCVPVYEALTIAEGLLQYRRLRGEYLLSAVGSTRLFDRLSDDSTFTIEQLKFLIEKHGMGLANKQNLAELRRKFCSYNELNSWYDFIQPFLHGIPHLTFNADETIVASHSDGKVITIKKRLPLVTGVKYNSHITAMCCFSASGVIVPLFVILQNLQNIPAELKDIPGVYYSSSSSGWMTHMLFTAWCIHFVTFISKYREDFLSAFHPLDKDKPIILFLDGHGSRINYEALYILRSHNIIAITFRSHTTHLCQPFDVVIAAPLKSYLRSYWTSAERRYQHIVSPELTGTKRLRFLLICSLIDAVNAAMSLANCATAFAKTGILPFNKQIVLSNPDYVQNNPGLAHPVQPPQVPPPNQIPPQILQPPLPVPQPFANPVQQWQQHQNIALQIRPQIPYPVENQPLKINGRIYIGEKIITSDKILLDLFCELNNTGQRPVIPPPINFIYEKSKVYQSQLKHGKMLSQFPLYYVRLPMGGLLQLQ